MKKVSSAALAMAALAISTPLKIRAQIALIAKRTLTGSPAGSNTDLSGLKGTLENLATQRRNTSVVATPPL